MIEGKWKLIGGEQDGQEVSEADCRRSTLEIVGNEHTVKVADDVRKGTHTLDASQSPSAIDVTDTEGPFTGQSLAGIFKVENDIFTVCFAAPGNQRPTEFSTKGGKATILHKWQRQTE